ncbi:DUF2058 domain-containing protein [Luteibacter yeojuensis]|uniref:Nucleoprotein/polynucleotide-associated enzyme n=1 Tax=Luteibacter yeojuensis TaxID=345309 RepID=A0A0F3KXD5_9GAMM|nr:DUF2058 domain-containing protein [Luteibacter yeojuensis]KJV35821.1 nucleoprotein/polynucleotide-associated enzyme [Luteibacter yeojuensis]
MRNPLQEQLLKAGLVKKDKVAKVVREQAKQRQGKAPAAPAEEKIDTRQLQAERAERDRALAAERNAGAKAKEIRAQVRQIVEAMKVKRDGDVAYRFNDGERITSILVSDAQRAQLAAGTLAIARHGEGFELIPRLAADKIHARAPDLIALDHGRKEGDPPPADDEDDDFYKQFVVPDDLMW